MKTYLLRVAGLKRQLSYFPIGNGLFVAGFVMLGDVELTVACARELLERCPDYDYLITPEAKSIPLAMEMARQRGDARYIVARKQTKLYMRDPLRVVVKSITTEQPQCLYLDGKDADMIEGKRVLIIDDVISTGNSLEAMEQLAKAAGAFIAGRAAVLAEGNAAKRDDILFLERLPLFTAAEVGR